MFLATGAVCWAELFLLKLLLFFSHPTFAVSASPPADVPSEILKPRIFPADNNPTEFTRLDEFQTSPPDNEPLLLSKSPHHRKRRSLPSPPPPEETTRNNLTIELLVLTDVTMATYHGANLENYVRTLLSITATVLHDPSLGRRIDLVLTKIVPFDASLLNLTLFDPVMPQGVQKVGQKVDGDDFLHKLLHWHYLTNYTLGGPNGSKDYDTVILLTRLDLCGSADNCRYSGLALGRKMCDRRESGLLVQDGGFDEGFRIAHELGHLMGLCHDDSEQCMAHAVKFGLPALESKMMHETSGDWFPWKWSECSRDMMEKIVSNQFVSCLKTRSTNKGGMLINPIDPRSQLKLPGQLYNMVDQCQLTGHQKGNDTWPLPSDPTDLLQAACPPVDCKRLLCPEETDTVYRCKPLHDKVVADGTPCDILDQKSSKLKKGREKKWCLGGQCVSKYNFPSPIDGGWSEWSKFSSCSRSCGGGITMSHRRCNNPEPQYGGKLCTGTRFRYESCNTMECFGEVDRNNMDLQLRESQCTGFRGTKFKLKYNLPHNLTWFPLSVNYTEKLPVNWRCGLICQNELFPNYAYYMEQDMEDGARCGFSPTNFNLCVDGVCRPAGCDRVLGSDKVLDECGVCGGNGSTCQRIETWFNQSVHRMAEVIRIPAGSFAIKIQQFLQLPRTKVTEEEDSREEVNNNFWNFLFGEEVPTLAPAPVTRNLDDYNYLALFDTKKKLSIFNDAVTLTVSTKGKSEIEAGGTFFTYSGVNFDHPSGVMETIQSIKHGVSTESELIVQVFNSKFNGDSLRVNIHVQFLVNRVANEAYEEKWQNLKTSVRRDFRKIPHKKIPHGKDLT